MYLLPALRAKRYLRGRHTKLVSKQTWRQPHLASSGLIWLEPPLSHFNSSNRDSPLPISSIAFCPLLPKSPSHTHHFPSLKYGVAPLSASPRCPPVIAALPQSLDTATTHKSTT